MRKMTANTTRVGLSLLATSCILGFMGLVYSAEEHTATLINTKGNSVGTATLTQTPQGVLIHTELHNLPEGWHGFHIHQTGQCSPPKFESAGGHFNPEKKAQWL